MDKPVITLDFASLYPSIMREHNMCHTTLIQSKEHAVAEGLDLDKDIHYAPYGHMFVKKHIREGILCRLLRELLHERGVAKKRKKNAKDPFMKAVFDGEQLALKVCANSVYGATGAGMGELFCLFISASVTKYGQ